MTAPTRHDLTPSSALSLAYFVFAYLGLAAALSVLVVDPGLPGGFFYHPRMIALVHLVTLAWISGSILGAFYIVAPLALRMAMPVGRVDWTACGAFLLGTTGMVAHLWFGDYALMVPDAVLVTGAIAWVGGRAWRGLTTAPVPWPITLHMLLAFANILGAAVIAIVVGLDRSRRFLDVSQLALTYAHVHLAAVGWATMMVVGLSYRLIPMMLPAAMPSGWRLALSAAGLEVGLLVVATALVTGSALLPVGAACIVAGLVSFARQMRATVSKRLPRPPALPRRDWSTWQAHAALAWLGLAVALGAVVSLGVAGDHQAAIQWAYGGAGLLGFLVQIVVGMQGRLVPMYAWFRALDLDGKVPSRAANELPHPAFARRLFVVWTIGTPVLVWGLAAASPVMIRAGAVVLLVGTAIGLAYLLHLMRAARTGR